MLSLHDALPIYEIRDAVQTGQTDQIRDVSGDDGPGGGIDDLFGGLPPAPGGTPGPRTTGNLEGYGTSLSFRYDGTTDPLQFLTEGTDLDGQIVAAGGPTPTLAIERSVAGNHVDATLDLDRGYRQDERRGGEESVSTGRARWSRYL